MKITKKEVVLFFALVFIMMQTCLYAETVKFKNGRIIKGEIIEKTDKKIKIELSSGMKATFLLKDVADIISADSNDSNPGSHKLRGYYIMDDPKKSTSRGKLGLRFLDDRRVEMLAGGRKLGDGSPAIYTIKGNQLKITHSCGVWHMEIRGDRLYHKDFKFYFVKK